MGLFKQVASEQVDLRRELLTAVKYSFSSESIRAEYLKSMTQDLSKSPGTSKKLAKHGFHENWLFDEEFMLGKSTFARTTNLRSLLTELQVLFITQSRNMFNFEQLLNYREILRKWHGI